MIEISRIADKLRRAHDGDPWHGPSLTGLLARISASEAAAHPLLGAHSIRETVLHVTAWIGEVREHLRETGWKGQAPPTASCSTAWCSKMSIIPPR
jgi:hypothetical protein